MLFSDLVMPCKVNVKLVSVTIRKTLTYRDMSLFCKILFTVFLDFVYCLCYICLLMIGVCFFLGDGVWWLK